MQKELLGHPKPKLGFELLTYTVFIGIFLGGEGDFFRFLQIGNLRLSLKENCEVKWDLTW